MQNRKLLLLGLLLPLMMSNSPAPMPTMDTYKDIEVCYEFIEESKDSKEFRYKITMKNNGDKYAQMNYIAPESLTNNLYNPETIFSNEYVAPGKQREFVGSFFEKLNDNETSWVAQCLVEDDPNVVVENPTIIRPADYEEEETYYQLNANISNLGDYNYWLVVDVIYKEKDLSFVIDIHQGNNKSLFYTYEKLDLDELSIQKTTVFRGKRFSYLSCS